jgi:Domain of unknown function (DUF4258)
MPMTNIKPFKPNDRQARQWLKEAALGKRRLLFSEHAELRMRQRKIGRRQVLETLGHGTISEPLHLDIQGNWRCNISWLHAGQRVTVGAVFKLNENGEWVIIATVFKE